MKPEWTRKEGKESERGGNRMCMAGEYKGSCRWRGGAGRAGMKRLKRGEGRKGRGGKQRGGRAHKCHNTTVALCAD